MEELSLSRQNSSNHSYNEQDPTKYVPIMVTDNKEAVSIFNEEKKQIACHSLSIVVFGASGDLARKKTYPALFSLYRQGLLPSSTVIMGYSRSEIPLDKFREKISSFGDKWGEDSEKTAAFLQQCYYAKGQYDSAEDVTRMASTLSALESQVHCTSDGANRIFYLAIPPTIFLVSAASIKAGGLSETGWNRVVVEKPFGRDLITSNYLATNLGKLFTEEQIFRIDHYLGKEMVQNLMVLRFANAIYEPIWNRHYIKCVRISFKEPFGTKGRGGYFDKIGIIRDVMQNHLLQIMSLVAMEPPVSLHAEDVRNEKVKLLRACLPIELEDVVLGQYTGDPNGSEVGYTDDDTVPNDSITPTFAQAVMYVNNSRWAGVPFIMKAGKALETRRAEIRIQFHPPFNNLFNDDLSHNELVMRVQPDEAVYMKMSTKKPGMASGIAHTDLDLLYKNKFTDVVLPDAYERLIYDVVRGDHNLFVRVDELEAAWRMFTPLLHAIDEQKPVPHKYQFNSRGPAAADEQALKYYARTEKYAYHQSPTHKPLKATRDPPKGKM